MESFEKSATVFKEGGIKQLCRISHIDNYLSKRANICYNNGNVKNGSFLNILYTEFDLSNINKIWK